MSRVPSFPRYLRTHDQELVASEPSDQIIITNDGPQSIRCQGEDLVSCCVSEAIVDRLEMTEVHKDHGDPLTDGRDWSRFALQDVENRRSIETRGQPIEVCPTFELATQSHLLGGVGKHSPRRRRSDRWRR